MWHPTQTLLFWHYNASSLSRHVLILPVAWREWVAQDYECAPDSGVNIDQSRLILCPAAGLNLLAEAQHFQGEFVSLSGSAVRS